MRSLIEEAMASSQLEGASTTRQIAKEMLGTGRQPRDRSEQMIFNNYAMMQSLRHLQDRPLSVDRILEMHRLLDRKSVGQGKSVYVRVDLGGSRYLKQKQNQ